MTESLAIMQTLEAYFPGSRPMLPDREAPEFQEAVRLADAGIRVVPRAAVPRVVILQTNVSLHVCLGDGEQR